jgi:hypothetical protein
MTVSVTRHYANFPSRLLQLAIIALACVALHGRYAHAEGLQSMDLRYMYGYKDKFDETDLYVATLNFPPPKFLGIDRQELAFGAFDSPDDTTAFVSFGPVWHLPFGDSAIFVDLGFSPTLLSKSKIQDEPVGGKFHFTSSVSLGAKFGENDSMSLALRVQHTSNGSIDTPNPGIDMLGVSFNIDLSD